MAGSQPNHGCDTTEPHQYLPTELLIAIVDHVEADEDLLALATTSRRLHDLSLPSFFLRHGFDPLTKELRLESFENSLCILKGLAIHLSAVGESLDYLSYDCGNTQSPERLVEELQLLTQYTTKLSSISRVSLRLATGIRDKTKECRDASVILLNTILSKSCRDIRIQSSQISSSQDVPKEILTSNKPADWLKNYWPARGPPPINSDDNRHLKTCFIQTFPAILRPLYFHALNVNSSVLTELSFKNIFGSGADWARMLSHLSFPHLRRLTIVFGVIPRDPLVKFLNKHPAMLSFFEYHHIRYDPIPKYRQRSDALRLVFQGCLETLVASPEHIVHFFPPFSCLSRLSAVTIKIEETWSTNFSALEASLKSVAACANKITLTLEISRTGLGFSVWFDRMFSGLPFPSLSGANRPEPLLRCVEALVMDNGNWGFVDSQMVARLPVWLSLFPELRMLTLVAGHTGKYRSSFDSHFIPPKALISSLREACPDLSIEFCAVDNGSDL